MDANIIGNEAAAAISDNSLYECILNPAAQATAIQAISAVLTKKIFDSLEEKPQSTTAGRAVFDNEVAQRIEDEIDKHAAPVLRYIAHHGESTPYSEVHTLLLSHPKTAALAQQSRMVPAAQQTDLTEDEKQSLSVEQSNQVMQWYNKYKDFRARKRATQKQHFIRLVEFHLAEQAEAQANEQPMGGGVVVAVAPRPRGGRGGGRGGAAGRGGPRGGRGGLAHVAAAAFGSPPSSQSSTARVDRLVAHARTRACACQCILIKCTARVDRDQLIDIDQARSESQKLQPQTSAHSHARHA